MILFGRCSVKLWLVVLPRASLVLLLVCSVGLTCFTNLLLACDRKFSSSFVRIVGRLSLYLSNSLACSNENFFSYIAFYLVGENEIISQHDEKQQLRRNIKKSRSKPSRLQENKNKKG